MVLQLFLFSIGLSRFLPRDLRVSSEGLQIWGKQSSTFTPCIRVSIDVRVFQLIKIRHLIAIDNPSYETELCHIINYRSRSSTSTGLGVQWQSKGCEE